MLARISAAFRAPFLVRAGEPDQSINRAQAGAALLGFSTALLGLISLFLAIAP